MNGSPMIFLIAFPVTLGIVMLFIPDRVRMFIKSLSCLASVFTLIAAVSVFRHKPLSWQSGGANILAADNLSGFIGLAIALFGILAAVYSCGYVQERLSRYFAYFFMTLGASFGAVYANNLLVLVSFWGFLPLALFLMTNLQNTEGASSAAKKALVIIGSTDALMIFGIGLVWMLSGTFSMSSVHLKLSGPLQYSAYLMLAIAAFAKAGAMPFHAWLPDVAEEAPTPVSAYLPASFDKLLGIYLLARASLDLFVMTPASNLLLLVVGSFTIVVAVMMALVQHNMKRLLGYHAVSQVGYMVLGIGTGSAIGIAGSLFHMLNNAVYKSCLFMTGGNVEKKAGTADLENMGGLWRYMPASFLACLIASLSISGIPPFNGFVSKWMIYQGIIETATGRNPLWLVWLVAAMFGSALTVASFMKLLHAVFLGRPSSEWKGVKDAGFAMTAPAVFLALLCIVFGIFAVVIPIKIFIKPVIPAALDYIGTWSPLAATGLLLIGVAAGFLVYALFRPGGFRTTDTFVGGEDPDSLGRVSGAEFYNTISDVAPVARVFKKEESGGFDVYAVGNRMVSYATSVFKRLHNGVLPTYIVWCLLGAVAVFAVLIFR